MGIGPDGTEENGGDVDGPQGLEGDEVTAAPQGHVGRQGRNVV